MKKRRRIQPVKTDSFYRQIWKVVDGAVADALAMHPEYLSEKHKIHDIVVRNSINKRVTGALVSYAKSVGPTRSVKRTGG